MSALSDWICLKCNSSNSLSILKCTECGHQPLDIPCKTADTMLKDEEHACKLDCGMSVTKIDDEWHPPFITADGVKWLHKYMQCDGNDIFIDSYAKCGTTMALYTVYELLKLKYDASNICGFNPSKIADPWNSANWIEVEASQELLLSMPPKKNKKGKEEPAHCHALDEYLKLSKITEKMRIWKTHASIRQFPSISTVHTSESKIIHITRNPKDVLCSYFDFYRKEPMVGPIDCTFDQLFDAFIHGNVVHSSFLKFEYDWWQFYQKHPDRVFWCHYEDLVKRPMSVLKSMARFLQIKSSEESDDDVAKDDTGADADVDAELYSIMERISFGKMKKTVQLSGSGTKMSAALMSKGAIGRWQTKLSEEQSKIIDQLIIEPLKEIGLEYQFT